ncbi:MAG: response regulator transcription factor [Bacteroidetes bacterium]|nr:response regulator transcription factor [Bacteroidota bacterium]
MTKIRILIADNSYLIRQGIRTIVDEVKDFSLLGEADTALVLSEKLLLCQPDVLIMDYTSAYFCLDDIVVIKQQFPDVNILAITNQNSKAVISKAIQYGVVSHLLKDCGREEIIEAIRDTAKGLQFFCGKVIDIIIKEKGEDIAPSLKTAEGFERISKSQSPFKDLGQRVSCDGIKVSAREIEIIQLVADGFSNKQIADKLFLSVHTITTHRKNIMNKLGVNNTAGLLMFAIRENLILKEQMPLGSHTQLASQN